MQEEEEQAAVVGEGMPPALQESEGEGVGVSGRLGSAAISAEDDEIVTRGLQTPRGWGPEPAVRR
uniref:Uncharacterized protein n=1 Tax=Arundo donax TaxID=35708 RepID=A0A0A9G322_ARUDO